MDEDTFNMQIRKFLKKVGITAQRDIEQAIREALADGRLAGDARLAVSATIRIADLDTETTIEDTIALE